MNPERLLTLALQGGLDLAFIAGRRPNKRERPRATPEIRHRQLWIVGAMPKQDLPKGLPPETFRTAKIKETKTRKAPEWTATDFAAACQAMDELPWAILCFTVFPGDEDRVLLKAALMALASKLSVREKWPAKIRRQNCKICGRGARGQYLEDLATLALIEWRFPDAYQTQEQLAEWFGVRRETWNQSVAKRYQPIREKLEVWYGAAMGHLWRSLTPAEETYCA